MSGFSLIEAVVAVGVLALGCLAAAGALHTALRAELAGGERSEAGRLLDAEATRLSSLPFHRRASGPGEGPPSLLAEVFPHARVELNPASGGFVGGCEAAVYVSEAAVEGRVLRRTATLMADTGAATVPVPCTDVAGWAVWDAEGPPALVVDLRLALIGGSGHATARHLVLRALRPHGDAEADLLAGRGSTGEAEPKLRGDGAARSAAGRAGS